MQDLPVKASSHDFRSAAQHSHLLHRGWQAAPPKPHSPPSEPQTSPGHPGQPENFSLFGFSKGSYRSEDSRQRFNPFSGGCSDSGAGKKTGFYSQVRCNSHPHPLTPASPPSTPWEGIAQHYFCAVINPISPPHADN